MKTNKIRFSLVILAVCLITGCINYEEVINLNSDGSGTLLMHYSLSQQLSAMMAMGGEAGGGADKPEQFPFKLKESEVKADLQAKGVKVEKFETKTENDQQHFYVNISFDKITDLNQTKTFKEMPFEWTKEGNVVTFKQILKGKKDAKAAGGPGDEMGKQMAQAMLGNATFKFEVKLPSKPLPPPDTNGTIAEDGRTVKWQFPLLEVSENEKVMTAKFKSGGLPISGKLLLLLGGAVVLSIGAFIFILAFARKK
jgi:LppM domain